MNLVVNAPVICLLEAQTNGEGEQKQNSLTDP